jgi:hypothetical protein
MAYFIIILSLLLRARRWIELLSERGRMKRNSQLVFDSRIARLCNAIVFRGCATHGQKQRKKRCSRERACVKKKAEVSGEKGVRNQRQKAGSKVLGEHLRGSNLLARVCLFLFGARLLLFPFRGLFLLFLPFREARSTFRRERERKR